MAYSKINVKNSVLQQGVHYLTSDWGGRNTKRPTHGGMDIIGKGLACDWIIAIEGGKIITCTYSSTAGYYVEIEHENGYISRYLHMKKGTFKVKKGDVVKKGQVLGYMGNTGSSKGAHLHFGVDTPGRKHVDPRPYLMGEKNFKKSSDPTPSGKYNLTRTLKKGCKGDDVKKLQKLIGTTADGVFGKNTESKLKTFQKNNKLTADGICGKNTAHKLGWLFKGK